MDLPNSLWSLLCHCLRSLLCLSTGGHNASSRCCRALRCGPLARCRCGYMVSYSYSNPVFEMGSVR